MHKDAVRVALENFDSRMKELQETLSPRILTGGEKDKARLLYTRLKDDLKTAARYGTLDGARRPRSPEEDALYQPAVVGALSHLRPATNSDPCTSNWAGSIYDARIDVTNMLAQLAGGSD